MVYEVGRDYPKLRKCPRCGTRFVKKFDTNFVSGYYCSGCLVFWNEEQYEQFCEEGKIPKRD